MDIFNFSWLFILFKFIYYDGEAIRIIISIISLLISLGATIAAFLAAKESKNASKSSLITGLLIEYSSDKYIKAIQKIKKWYKKTIESNKNQNKDDTNKLNSNNYLTEEIDGLRRLLSHHIYHICKLYDENILDDKIFKIVMPIDKAEFAIKYIEKLDKIKREDYDKSPYDILCKKYRNLNKYRNS